MSKNNPAPSDEDVAKLIANLGGSMSAPAAPASEPTAESPVDVPADVAAAAGEDDRPIVLTLPPREDPTATSVGTRNDGTTIPAVEPFVAPDAVQPVQPSSVIAPIAAAVQTTKAVVTPIVQTPATAQQDQAVEPDDPSSPKSLDPEIQAVLKEYGVAAWKNTDDPEKPYWIISQGSRKGGVPDGAPASEWKGRCAAISISI